LIDAVPSSRFLSLVNSRWLLIASLLLFALVLNREGDQMPTGNEFVYLLYFYKAWHPQFLATDWTFQETTAGHAIFSITTGWLTRLMSLTSAAWLGRLLSWIATYLGLFRLGRHYKIKPWAVWVGLVLWLLQRQSPITREWMIGTFEAKVIAYPCLLFAIDAALGGRAVLAGVLCGIAFSYHSAVGMWAGAALGVMILLSCPIRKTVEFSLATILFSLPGLITSWKLIAGPHAISLDEAKYLTTISLPDCFDAAGFSHTWMALLLILPVFAWMHARWQRGDRQIRELLIFQITLAIFFAFGIVSRIIGRFDWVELFPMRVYAVFGLLLFFWQAMSVVVTFLPPKNNVAPPRSLIVFGLLILLCMPSPILQLRDMIASHLTKYLHPVHNALPSDHGDDADFVTAAKWVNAHAGPSDMVIAPPWCNSAYYYIQRPLIANWHAPRYDRMTEWRQRIEALSGDLSDLTFEDGMTGEMNSVAWTHYAHLSIAELTAIQNKFPPCQPAKWLITTGKYPMPVALQTKTYTVYKLNLDR
jgi:hypothetical protein